MKFSVSFVANTLADQFRKQEPAVSADLAGKTVVIVGANTGLGFEACKHFTRMGPARLIMACRNQQRGEEALQSLEETTGYKKAELSLLDIGSFQSIKEFVARWQGRLDILVMNAGIATLDYTQMEGWESTIKINHLGTAFTTFLLLPHLKATADKYAVVPRVVVVSSDAHFLSPIPEQIINDDNEPILRKLSNREYCTNSVMRDRYNMSKLLNVFFVRALTEHLRNALFPVIVNLVNPGYCYSGLLKKVPPQYLAIFWVSEKLFALTAEEGSRALVLASVGLIDDEERLRGGYVSFNKIKDVSTFATSETGIRCQERLWNETIGILAAEDPKIREISDGRLEA